MPASGSHELGSDASAQNAAPAMTTADKGWDESTENSAIDGTVDIARKIFEFEEKRSTFAAEFRCVESTKSVTFSLESYIGDPSVPSEGSEFARQFGTNAWGQVYVTPIGRAKPNGLDVRGLGALFAISNTASNRIELRQFSTTDDVVRLPPEMVGVSGGDINFARVVRDMLPLSLEINNGAGASEIVIGPSEEVLNLLNACGGDGDLVKPEAVARMTEERQKYEADAKAEAERKEQEAMQAAEQAKQREMEEAARLAADCRNRGDSSPASNCADRFPEDYAAFNAAIDTIYAVPKRHGFLCNKRGSREDLVKVANAYGIEYAKLFVKQKWCDGAVNMDEP